MKKASIQPEKKKESPFVRLGKLLYGIGLGMLLLLGIAVSQSFSQKPTGTYQNCSSLLRTIQRPTLSRVSQPIPQQVSRDNVQTYRQLRGEGYPDTEILQHLDCQKRNSSIRHETDFTLFVRNVFITVIALLLLHVVLSKSFVYVVKGK